MASGGGEENGNGEGARGAEKCMCVRVCRSLSFRGGEGAGGGVHGGRGGRGHDAAAPGANLLEQARVVGGAARDEGDARGLRDGRQEALRRQSAGVRGTGRGVGACARGPPVPRRTTRRDWTWVGASPPPPHSLPLISTVQLNRSGRLLRLHVGAAVPFRQGSSAPPLWACDAPPPLHL